MVKAASAQLHQRWVRIVAPNSLWRTRAATNMQAITSGLDAECAAFICPGLDLAGHTDGIVAVAPR